MPDMLLTWDGRLSGTNGGDIVPYGRWAYTVDAEFIRVRQVRHRPKEVLIDDTETVRHWVTIRRLRPGPPSVAAVPPLTNVPLLLLSGTRPANTSIWVDGAERVPLDASTTWNTTKTLVEGANSIVVTVRDIVGTESLPVTVRVTLDTVLPSEPVMSLPPEVTTTRTQVLSGTKEAGTAVLINGEVVVPTNDQTTWSATVTLQEGENRFVVQSVDRAGNKSMVAGSETAQCVTGKPVIGDLSVAPSEIRVGENAQIRYRLYAAVPPLENGQLKVTVQIEDGDRIVRTLSSVAQSGDPTGPEYTVSWDGADGSGQPVAVNTSYRVVVSADRANPTTLPPSLANANPQETAVVVVGSQHAASSDGKLELIFRPDDAKVTITRSPILSQQAGRMMMARGLRGVSGLYEIRAERALSGPVVGVYKTGRLDGWLIRPFFWEESLQDWVALTRSNWSRNSQAVSFALPRPGLLVLAGTEDATPPEIRATSVVKGRLEIQAIDRGRGVNTERMRVGQGSKDLTRQAGVQLLNGVHEILVVVKGYDPAGGAVSVYLEDWVGNGRLHVLRNP